MGRSFADRASIHTDQKTEADSHTSSKNMCGDNIFDGIMASDADHHFLSKDGDSSDDPEVLPSTSQRDRDILASLRSVFLVNNEISELDVSPDGEKYVGQISDNKREGDGAWLREDGSVVYTGDWRNNAMEGEGTYNFTSGSYYSGSWIDGHMEGEGLFHSVHNWVYHGAFAASRRQGKGTYEDATINLKYDGEWAFDLPHGKGYLTIPDGTITQGFFRHGEYISGTTTWSNGDTYTGEWHEGLRHGHGSSTFSNGEKVYEGQWELGVPHGAGKLVVLGSPSGLQCGWYGAGYSCEGQWNGGKMHGHISEQFADGRGSFIGEFKNGLRHGNGTLWIADWGKIEGEWEAGMLKSVGCILAAPTQATRTPAGSLGPSAHKKLALLVAKLLGD